MAAHASVFLLISLAYMVAVFRGRLEPSIGLLLAAGALGAGSGFSVGQIGKSFGNGFGGAAGSTGIYVLAASLVGAMAAFASDSAWPGRWRARKRAMLPVFGFLAGMGAAPAAAFAVLTPLRENFWRASSPRAAIRLGLAISAGQGGVLPSPVLVAATTILGADFWAVFLAGISVTVLVTAGMWWVTRAVPDGAEREIGGAGSPRPAFALFAACALMLGLLIVQSLGHIPSEPLGGGGTREFLLGAGRPFAVLLAGVAVMVCAMRPGQALRGFSRDGFAAIAVSRAASLILLVGVAGGFQSVAQDTHLADTLAEAASIWHGGLLVPFVVAAVLKSFQGSSLVAAITASGLVQPVLASLGLDDFFGRACAALAVGAGAMAGAFINDGFFWLVVEGGGLRGGQAVGWVTLGTVFQGGAIVALLEVARIFAR